MPETDTDRDANAIGVLETIASGETIGFIREDGICHPTDFDPNSNSDARVADIEARWPSAVEALEWAFRHVNERLNPALLCEGDSWTLTVWGSNGAGPFLREYGPLGRLIGFLRQEWERIEPYIEVMDTYSRIVRGMGATLDELQVSVGAALGLMHEVYRDQVGYSACHAINESFDAVGRVMNDQQALRNISLCAVNNVTLLMRREEVDKKVVKEISNAMTESVIRLIRVAEMDEDTAMESAITHIQTLMKLSRSAPGGDTV